MPMPCKVWIMKSWVEIFVFLIGFWQRTNFYQEQAEIHFKHEALVILYLSNDYITWSTFQNYNVLQMEKLRVPLVKVSLFSHSEVHTVLHGIYFRSTDANSEWVKDWVKWDLDMEIISSFKYEHHSSFSSWTLFSLVIRIIKWVNLKLILISWTKPQVNLVV